MTRGCFSTHNGCFTVSEWYFSERVFVTTGPIIIKAFLSVEMQVFIGFVVKKSVVLHCKQWNELQTNFSNMQ